MPTILITGATGFIGKALCAKLSNDCRSFKALVRKESAGSNLRSELGNLDYVVADLMDKESLNLACKDIHTVVHLAGIAHVNNVSANDYKKTIVTGSANLFEACTRNGVKRVVFLSSALAESAEKNAPEATAYGSAKLEAEKNLVALCKNSEMEFVILRPVNIYGPGMKGNITRMIRWVQRGLLPALPKLETKVSLLSIEDLLEFLQRAIDQPAARDECYVLAEPKHYRLSEIEQEIYKHLARNYPTRRSPRMLLYVAAVTAGIVAKTLGLFGIKTPLSSISIRTYSNLINDSIYDGSNAIDKLGFVPKGNLYKQMPTIIQALNTE